MTRHGPLLIKGGQIMDPGKGLNLMGNILLNDGLIAWMGKSEPPPLPFKKYHILDTGGMVVCPGFIDMHCHLRQPGYENKETIATGTKAAAKGGFTTVCCMPNTSPPLDTEEYINYVKLTAELESMVRVLPVACISKGRMGEELVDMVNLKLSGVAGFSDDGSPVMNSLLMRQALEYSAELGLPVIDHCEDINLARGGQVNEGKVSKRLHFKGIPAVAEELMVVRDIALASLTGGYLHIAHVSTEGSVELIRQAKEKGINVTAEVTPHHLTLTEDIVKLSDTSTKVNPPLRSKKDVAALVRGLRESVIDIIATDHAPHTDLDKLPDYIGAAFGISGLETALGSVMSLVHDGLLDLKTVIASLTTEPACIIGGRFGNLGTLEVGATADVTVFDPNKEWLVDVNEFASKGKNTPLKGAKLRGKVMATISMGKLVYKDDSLKLTEKVVN
jgi:dihydroorotase